MEKKRVGGKYKVWARKIVALVVLVGICLIIVLPLLTFEYVGTKLFKVFEKILGYAAKQGDSWIFPTLEECKRTLTDNVREDNSR